MNKQAPAGPANDKMREEFEAAIAKNQLDNEFPPANFERCGLDGRYVLPELEGAWWVWQASRAAVVLELPEKWPNEVFGEDVDIGFNRCVDECRETFEAAGFKVKP